MQEIEKDKKAVVWIGAEDVILRKGLTNAIEELVNKYFVHDGTEVTVLASDLNAPSLMNVMRENNPEFFKAMDERDARLQERMKCVETQAREIQEFIAEIDVAAIAKQAAAETLAEINRGDPFQASMANYYEGKDVK